MLNPIDTEAVIRDDRISGVFPGEIHEGVAWWAGACHVVLSRASQMAVAHDGHPTTAEFHRRLCRGAVNAEHYACLVSDLGTAYEDQLRHAMKALGDVPGALLSTAGDSGRQTVTIRLYDAQGRPVTEDTGLAKIRKLIDADRVPRPVNNRAKGRVVERRDLVEAL
ncbi:hypothetical protein [Streptomyces sp. NPDC006195]|uniref:hypothetical protein n=1 Tax=unclassified Streptomyces TaxID=2593676 RepID=UPI0033A8B6CE